MYAESFEWGEYGGTSHHGTPVHCRDVVLGTLVQYACKIPKEHSCLMTSAQNRMAALDAVCWREHEADYPVCKNRANIKWRSQACSYLQQKPSTRVEIATERLCNILCVVAEQGQRRPAPMHRCSATTGFGEQMPHPFRRCHPSGTAKVGLGLSVCSTLQARPSAI